MSSGLPRKKQTDNVRLGAGPVEAAATKAVGSAIHTGKQAFYKGRAAVKNALAPFREAASKIDPPW